MFPSAALGRHSGAQWGGSASPAARTMHMDVEGQRADGFGVGGARKGEPRHHRRGCARNWARIALDTCSASPEPVISLLACRGRDTFDCESARRAHPPRIYSPDGRFNITNACFKRDFTPLVEGCGCYTCTHYTRGYLHLQGWQKPSATLPPIHNEWFTLRLVDSIRDSIEEGCFAMSSVPICWLPQPGRRR